MIRRFFSDYYFLSKKGVAILHKYLEECYLYCIALYNSQTQRYVIIYDKDNLTKLFLFAKKQSTGFPCPLNTLDYLVVVLYRPQREKTCLRGVANNTDADQPAHPRSLISAFVIRFLESIMSRLTTSEISFF